jgi:hypothetical protein
VSDIVDMRRIENMNTLNMHLTASTIEGERGVAARPVRIDDSRRASAVKAASAIERQLDVITRTFTPSWEW